MGISVNADDLGLSPQVNEETFSLIARRVVHSASILANAPETLDAVARAKQHPHCRFGVHLNVTEFSPISPSAGLEPLLDQDGRFVFNVLWRAPKTRSLRRAIYREWSSQIRRCIEFGITPAHLDSHHDIHLLPGLFPVLKRLQWEFGIRHVRRRNNIQPAAAPMRRRLWHGFWSVALNLSGADTARFVGELNQFRKVVESGEWKARDPGFKSSIELIVHPGNDFDPVFQLETELLRSGWLQAVEQQWTAVAA
jgi:chitin disaccharide deacetylase